jgi:Zn ribbon nucleic-acid-binding protein
MGEDNSKGYDRQERINDLEKKSNRIGNDIDKMWDDPRFSFEECIHAGFAQRQVDDHIKSLKQMNKLDKNFKENINLNDYRNPDGSFNVYKAEIPLEMLGGEKGYKMLKILHHEGFAIGNGEKMLFCEYGITDDNLELRIWDSEEKKEDWVKIEQVGKSYASNEDVYNILFGENSEKWVNPHDYNLLSHNCQIYAKQKIKQ